MRTSTSRQCGIGVPLFSLVSSRSWGIGEFADLPAFGTWCAAAGQRYVQVLPLNKGWVLNKTVQLPADMPFTAPYWLRTTATEGMYAVDDQQLRGLPETPPFDRRSLSGRRAALPNSCFSPRARSSAPRSHDHAQFAANIDIVASIRSIGASHQFADRRPPLPATAGMSTFARSHWKATPLFSISSPRLRSPSSLGRRLKNCASRRWSDTCWRASLSARLRRASLATPALPCSSPKSALSC